MFECVAARISFGLSICLADVIYRTSPATVNFFVELSDILDHLSTTGDPLLLAGDVNIHLKHALNTSTTEFINLLECHGLVQRVTGASHDAGGTIDVVCTRCDLPLPTVDIVGVSLSDHRLLRRASRLHRPLPVLIPSTRRIWRLFDAAAFRTSLCASVLCDERHWNLGDVLVNLYDSTVVVLSDQQITVRHITCRRRSSCAWF